jgi:histidyl-tRNA synthetase
MLTKAPRGTKDILPQEAYKWHHIEEQARKICREFGFGEIRTPVFEHTELFLRGVGETTDIVQKEMYTFDDRGGRSITLKPEGTAPAVRAFIENGMASDAQPTKLYYLSPIFRYEKPQAGRLRQHHQFGVEIYGAEGYSADAEVISLAMTFLKRLGITNLKANINSIGCPECRKNYNNSLKDYFRENLENLCSTCQDRFERNPLRILDCKNPSCGEIGKGAPVVLDYLCGDCKDHFEGLQGELTALEIPYTVDPNIVRGLDYYTRTVFEIISENIGAKSTVCGGGRYDKLIKECGGPDTPSVGFGLGIERLILTMEAYGAEVKKPEGPALFIAALGDNAKLESSRMVLGLRESGISCERDLMSRSLKAQMKYANKIGARYTMVLGDDELTNKSAKLKNMENGEEVQVDLNNLASELKERI